MAAEWQQTMTTPAVCVCMLATICSTLSLIGKSDAHLLAILPSNHTVEKDGIGWNAEFCKVLTMCLVAIEMPVIFNARNAGNAQNLRISKLKRLKLKAV